FASGKYADFFEYIITRKQEASQNRTQFGFGVFGCKGLQLLQDGILQVQGFQLVLRKKCLRHIVSFDAFSGVFLIGIGNYAQERRLSLTVSTNEGYFIAFFDKAIGVFEDFDVG